MSLIRFLTGNPGNFKEFLEVAKKDKSSVNVIFHAYDDMNQLGDELIKGQVFYSCRGKDSKSNFKKYRLRLRPLIMGGGLFDRQWTGRRMLKTLTETQEDNLNLLKKEGINYNTRLLNRCYEDLVKKNSSPSYALS